MLELYTGSAQALDMPEVLAAVETLYMDEHKPYARILRKRLIERAASAGLGCVDVDMKHLGQVCENCPWFCVQVEKGGDWSVLLRDKQPSFVDVYSPQDLYPPELWQAASLYFEGVDDDNMMLPGGRYSCAQTLVARGLPFLCGRTLGQVCHIVQLAISQKKLLGYLNGAVVPYGRSQSKVKERCAEKQKPCAGAVRGSGSSGLADWEAVVKGLKEILDSTNPGAPPIPLSNIKRLFRSRFHCELSETSLGHSKLSDLVQDPRLRTVCSVHLQGHGYVLSPAPAQPLQVQPRMSAAAAGAAVVAAAAAAACGLPTPPQAAHFAASHWPRQEDIASSGSESSSQAVLQLSAMPSSALPKQTDAVAYNPAVTKAISRIPAQQASTGDSLRSRARFVQPLSMEDVESVQPTYGRALASGCLQPPSPFETGMPVMTPTPTATHHFTSSVLRSLDTDQALWERTCQSIGLIPPEWSKDGALQEGSRPVDLCPVPATPETLGFPCQPMLMPHNPHIMGGIGYNVQNTFINFAPPPPTPLAASVARSPSSRRHIGEADVEAGKPQFQTMKQKSQQEQGCRSSPAAPRVGPASRLMSAAAAAIADESKEYPGTAAEAALASEPNARVVRIADLL